MDVKGDGAIFAKIERSKNFMKTFQKQLVFL